jgi:predicted transposase YdaD
MPFISRVEEMAKEEGRLEGRQEGRLEGTQEGTKRTLREDILAILEIRFNTVPSEIVNTLNSIEDADTLRRLHRQAIAIPSMAEFEQLAHEATA